MSIDLTAVVTITAPTGVDGNGGIAVLNNSASSNFVGYLYDVSGFDGPGVRTSMDDIVQGHGAVFSSFWHGPRAFTLEIALARASTWALSFTDRRDKLYRATNAMASDGVITWTESGGTQKYLFFRREQPPRGPDKDGHVLVAGISADPYIYAGNASRSAATSHTFTPVGNAEAFPVFTIASPSATVNISRTSPSPTETLTFTGLSGGGTVTVDFKNRTITQGGVSKYGAISWPSSTWWSLKPGVSNTVTITNAATVDWQAAWL